MCARRLPQSLDAALTARARSDDGVAGEHALAQRDGLIGEDWSRDASGRTQRRGAAAAEAAGTQHQAKTQSLREHLTTKIYGDLIFTIINLHDLLVSGLDFEGFREELVHLLSLMSQTTATCGAGQRGRRPGGTGGRRTGRGGRRREEGGLAGNMGTAEAEGQVTKGRKWELRGRWAGKQVRAEAGQHGCCPASVLAIWSRRGHFPPKSNTVK